MNPNRCTRCLLTDDVPGVVIEEDAQCSVCKEHDKQWGNWDEVKKDRRADLERLLTKAKRRNKIYDVMVPLSGGKDSTYVLYLCRRQFDLKCLAVTFDNGFLSDHALENIRNACDVLGVDHICVALNKSLMMRLYRYSFLKTGYFCPICLMGMGAILMRTQRAFGIPFSISGTSNRTEEYISKEFFVCSRDFVSNLLVGSPLEEEARIFLEPVGLFKSPPSIRLPDYLDWNYNEIFTTISQELGWRAHRHQAEHSDCTMDNIVNWVRYKRFPALVPEMLRFSKLVTVGQMTREEAEKKVAEQQTLLQEPPNLPVFFKALDISKEEFEFAVANPLKHLPYMRSRSRIERRLKGIYKRFGF